MTPAPAKGGDPEARSCTERVERRVGPEGPQWRGLLKIRGPGIPPVDVDTGWHSWPRFTMEYASLHRRQLMFLFAGVGRPVVGELTTR